ncbi:MAG: NUDIX domain-containing protein [Candidatus Niyogibacteria bacterium]|nr:NUDIX domain-containing protein [Candidatus Niyogibacteria bacterium]
MDILVQSYTEAGFKPIPSLRLSDEEYGRVLQCLVYTCTDIVPIDAERKVIYLARRASKPNASWWWIGGRMAAHETKEEAAVRNFRRETGLEISEDRLKLVAIVDCRWKDRAQPPQEIGCHPATYVFTIELTAEERAGVSANLDAQEYEREIGLSDFSREQLVGEKVVSPILELYDHIFPPEEDVKCGPLPLASSDARRDIREFEFRDSAFQAFFIRDASKPLGQHFHREKFEIFYFSEGGGVIRTAKVNAAGTIVGEVKRFEVGSGSIIRIPPMHTHRFDLVPNTRFVAFSSKPFDPKDLNACPIG